LPPAPTGGRSLARVRELIAAKVKTGSGTREEVAANAVEFYKRVSYLPADEIGETGQIDLERAVARITDEELEAHRRREATWTSPTDCDRLDRAFARLEMSGILARQDFRRLRDLRSGGDRGRDRASARRWQGRGSPRLASPLSSRRRGRA
jgi:hypothetical protein